MGITNSNKQVNATSITCNETFKVTLSLTASPDIVSNPTDIVLILDRSGSMAGSALANLKNGAKKFIDIIDESTDSSHDGQIGGGSRIGIVSFSTTATQDTQLITSVNDLKTAVDNLSASGSTNHADAFTKALQLFDPTSTNEKVMIMFTDGLTTAGGNPNTVATLAKSQGIIIYSIGLSGQDGIDVNALNDWSSDPNSAYVVITPDDEELENIFADLAKNISKTGATNIVLTDTINDCFEITDIDTPNIGNAIKLNNTTVEWKIDELGVTGSEGAILEFTVKHIGPCTGEIKVNEDIAYTDSEGNVVTFPDPSILVECDDTVITEPCPTKVDLEITGCKDSIEFDAGDIELTSLGRILQIDTTIKNVCPNKRVALAVMLNEVDDFDVEYKRGFKVLTIPAHTQNTCQDILIKCIKFVLPEDLNVTNSFNMMCTPRKFRVSFIANYIDYDFNCCDTVLTNLS